MAISQTLLPELDQEGAVTRKYLERVPNKPEFRPHAKSMTLARLAGHVAELPMWAVMTMTQESLDLTPAGGKAYEAFVSADSAALVATFDRQLADARRVIEQAGDADFMVPWSLIAGGKTHFTLPRAVVLRSFVFSHLIHHRAQLGVYLRLNDVPVPATYGPTADEGPM